MHSIQSVHLSQSLVYCETETIRSTTDTQYFSFAQWV